MGTLRLACSGIWHRRTSSLLVVLLVAVSVAAAVFAPAYSRAVEQWSLRDGLRTAAPALTTLTVASPQVYDHDTDPAEIDRAARAFYPLDRYYGQPVRESRFEGKVTFGSDAVDGRVAAREGQCTRLIFTAGRCPQATGEFAAPAGSGAEVGARIAVEAGAMRVQGTVVGLYKGTSDRAFWGPRAYFDAAVGQQGSRDFFGTLFTVDDTLRGAVRDFRFVGRIAAGTSYDYPIIASRVDLTTLDALTSALRRPVGGQSVPCRIVFGEPLPAPDVMADCDRRGRLARLTASTNLANVLLEVKAQRAVAVRSVLFVAVQLVVLCWLVVYLVLANLAESRSTELAVAKLRGFRAARVLRFGLVEAVLLVAVAGPVGAGLGWLAVQGGIWGQLRELDVRAEYRMPMFLTGGGVFVGALLVAVLASVAPLRRPVLGLLRRVSTGLRRRLGFLDAALFVVAGFSVWALVTRSGDSDIALVAGSFAALSAGGLAGRVVALLARRRGPAAVRRGRPVPLLAWSAVGRRQGGPRLVALVVVATALSAYGLFSWGMAAHNREVRAGIVTGAPVVYRLEPVGTDKLLNAVAKVDPQGRFAMAAVDTVLGVGEDTSHVVGVDTTRLPRVGYWNPGTTGSDVSTVADLLHPPADAPITLHGPHVEVDLTALVMEPAGSLTFGAQLDTPAGRRTVSFTKIATGANRFAADMPDCASTCRLIGFNAYRAGGPIAAATLRGDLLVTGLRDASGDLAGRLRTADAWRGAEPASEGQPVATALAGEGGLRITFTAPPGENLAVLHVDAPYPTPAVVSDPRFTVGDFHGAGLYGIDQAYRGVLTAPVLPGVGKGILVDLAYGDRAAPTYAIDADTTPMVWARADAPADLAARLTGAGLTIVDVTRLGDRRAVLDDQGSAVALRLYVVAAIGALLLGVLGVPLTARPGAQDRAYEAAALRVAGLSRRQVRRAVLREYTLLLVIAVGVGAAAGTVTGVLTLPHLLPAAGQLASVPIDYWPAPAQAGAALALIILVYGLVAVTAMRTTMRRGHPRRLREGTS
ncbi:FtsX-like permease family protein [Longispora sp. K20-0274]|uniref:FtsX-like permease family protein n=1 Tax=Longispora sp. K20-0274 TaxID=3088255 RepID=UPI00399B7892